MDISLKKEQHLHEKKVVKCITCLYIFSIINVHQLIAEKFPKKMSGYCIVIL